MKIKTVLPNVFLVSFPNKKELTFTMCRVEEFYEAASDRLRGQVFTWPEFIDEFTDNEGHFDYFHSWSGFNVPGDVFVDWAVKFKDKSKQERDLYALVISKTYQLEKFYIIAAVESDTAVEEHEIAHARYYVDDMYRAAMLELNSKLDADARKLMTEEFTNLGYSATVHEDELQAFLSTSTYEYLEKRFKMPQEMFDRVTPAYIEVFRKD
jgi:hypothetical protein